MARRAAGWQGHEQALEQSPHAAACRRKALSDNARQTLKAQPAPEVPGRALAWRLDLAPGFLQEGAHFRELCAISSARVPGKPSQSCVEVRSREPRQPRQNR